MGEIPETTQYIVRRSKEWESLRFQRSSFQEIHHRDFSVAASRLSRSDKGNKSFACLSLRGTRTGEVVITRRGGLDHTKARNAPCDTGDHIRSMDLAKTKFENALGDPRPQFHWDERFGSSSA